MRSGVCRAASDTAPLPRYACSSSVRAGPSALPPSARQWASTSLACLAAPDRAHAAITTLACAARVLPPAPPLTPSLAISLSTSIARCHLPPGTQARHTAVYAVYVTIREMEKEGRNEGGEMRSNNNKKETPESALYFCRVLTLL